MRRRFTAINIVTRQQEICVWLKVVELNKCVVFILAVSWLLLLFIHVILYLWDPGRVWLYKTDEIFCAIVGKKRLLAWRKKWGIKHILCSAAVLILQWLLALKLIKPQLCQHTSSSWWGGGQNGLPFLSNRLMSLLSQYVVSISRWEH